MKIYSNNVACSSSRNNNKYTPYEIAITSDLIMSWKKIAQLSVGRELLKTPSRSHEAGSCKNECSDTMSAAAH
jgi:hypothetical protein